MLRRILMYEYLLDWTLISFAPAISVFNIREICFLLSIGTLENVWVNCHEAYNFAQVPYAEIVK